MAAVIAPDQGWSAREAADIAEITYRQLDYWARTDLIRPSLADAKGSGSRRRYSAADIAMLCLIRQMLNSGLRLDVIRHALEVLQGTIQDGLIVVVRGDEGVVLPPEQFDVLPSMLRDGPCHTFPITFPNMTRGTCKAIGRIHAWPHIEDRTCVEWEAVDV